LNEGYAAGSSLRAQIGLRWSQRRLAHSGHPRVAGFRLEVRRRLEE